MGGPPNFIKRDKTLYACARLRQVIVANGYPDTPLFGNPVSAPEIVLRGEMKEFRLEISPHDTSPVEGASRNLGSCCQSWCYMSVECSVKAKYCEGKCFSMIKLCRHMNYACSHVHVCIDIRNIEEAVWGPQYSPRLLY